MRDFRPWQERASSLETNPQKPLFQHRHYAKIASIIAELPAFPLLIESGDHREFVAAAFARALLGTNPNYDADRFYEAATGKPMWRDK